MKIIDKRTTTKVKFSELEPGDCFSAESGTLALKIERYDDDDSNAVYLDNGERWWLADDRLVTRVDATITITG